jgi:hypothetical protein
VSTQVGKFYRWLVDSARIEQSPTVAAGFATDFEPVSFHAELNRDEVLKPQPHLLQVVLALGPPGGLAPAERLAAAAQSEPR